MENIKRVLSYTRRAVDDYEMIHDGDKVAVGISGGKDSLTLLCALADLKKFYPKSLLQLPHSLIREVLPPYPFQDRGCLL